MANSQQFGKVNMSKAWQVGGQTFTNKYEAYRYCRTKNGTKAGGTKPFKVQRTVA
jgi:hypothetical protein